MYYHPKYYKEMRAEKRKLQAASPKLQAPSEESSKLQAPSSKPEVPSSKPQAASSLIREPGIKWKCFEDRWPRASTRINVFLGCVTCHAIWCGENLTFFPFVTFNSTVKNVPKVLYPNTSGLPRELRFSSLVQTIPLEFLRSFWYNFASGPMS